MNYDLKWQLKNDSILILDGYNQWFFFRILNGYSDNEEMINSKRPDDFYPFGNIIIGMKNFQNSYKIEFARSGSYVSSLDPYISQVVINDNGTVNLHFYNGMEVEVYHGMLENIK